MFSVQFEGRETLAWNLLDLPRLAGQTGDLLELTEISRDEWQLEFQSRRGDEQIHGADRGACLAEGGPEFGRVDGGGGREGENGEDLKQPLDLRTFVSLPFRRTTLGPIKQLVVSDGGNREIPRRLIPRP